MGPFETLFTLNSRNIYRIYMRTHKIRRRWLYRLRVTLVRCRFAERDDFVLSESDAEIVFADGVKSKTPRNLGNVEREWNFKRRNEEAIYICTRKLLIIKIGERVLNIFHAHEYFYIDHFSPLRNFNEYISKKKETYTKKKYRRRREKIIRLQ